MGVSVEVGTPVPAHRLNLPALSGTLVVLGEKSGAE
jgi:hypothetical protein